MPEHDYRLDLLNKSRGVFSKNISCTEPTYFLFDTEKCRYYQVEVFDETRRIRIAIGNPIWNE